MLYSVNESRLSALTLDFDIVFDMCQYAVVTHVTIKQKLILLLKTCIPPDRSPTNIFRYFLFHLQWIVHFSI